VEYQWKSLKHGLIILCGVEATPTLVALTDGNISAKMAEYTKERR
jgi:hypothetical protein